MDRMDLGNIPKSTVSSAIGQPGVEFDVPAGACVSEKPTSKEPPKKVAKKHLAEDGWAVLTKIRYQAPRRGGAGTRRSLRR